MVKIDLTLRQYLNVSEDDSRVEYTKNIESFEKKDFVEYFIQDFDEQQTSEKDLETDLNKESEDEDSDVTEFQ